MSTLANIKLGKVKNLKKWGGILGTWTWNYSYTEVPAPSGLIDRTIKIVKISAYLLNIVQFICTGVSNLASYFYQLFGIFMHPEDKFKCSTSGEINFKGLQMYFSGL